MNPQTTEALIAEGTLQLPIWLLGRTQQSHSNVCTAVYKYNCIDFEVAVLVVLLGLLLALRWQCAGKRALRWQCAGKRASAV